MSNDYYVAVLVQVLGRYFANMVVEVHANTKAVGVGLRAGGVRIMVFAATPAEATPAAFMVIVITPVSAVTTASENLPATARAAIADAPG